MLRRLAPACALFLLATACGGVDFDVRAQEVEGPSWFPQIVENEQDAGQGLSITTDAEGNPHLAYVELPGTKEEQEDAETDPLSTKMPAIGHAHLVDQIWTRSEVVQSDGKEPEQLFPEDETAIAVDAEGTHHIIWSEFGEVWYSTDPTGEQKPQVVDPFAAPRGLSIWTDEKGTPWIAYFSILSTSDGPGALIRVATLDGKDWKVETVAETDTTSAYSTGIGPGQDGPIVAYGDTQGTMLARRAGSRWESEVVDPDGGLGVSMDLDADGNPHLAYSTPDGQIRHAHSIGGGDWEISDVGAGIADATTSIAVDDEGVHHIAWQRDVDIAYANNAGGEFAEVPLPAAMAGGQRPRLAVGAENVYLAWYSPEGTRLGMATFGEEEPLLAVPSPSAAPGGGAVAACDPEGDTLQITAEGLAFDKDCLAVEAGQPYTIEFDNQDSGQTHNVNVYTDDSLAEPLLMPAGSGTIPGPGQTTYEGEPIDEAGDHYFQCDVHPTMNGTFVVAGK